MRQRLFHRNGCRDHIVGNDVEQPQAGPQGEGQDARSHVAVL